MGTSTKANRKPYTVIKPGSPVVLLTYMVGICPDGNTDEEYEPFPVHLRKTPDEMGEMESPPARPDDKLKAEILKRAVKIERREHPSTPEERTFTLGTVRLTRNRLDVAR